MSSAADADLLGSELNLNGAGAGRALRAEAGVGDDLEVLVGGAIGRGDDGSDVCGGGGGEDEGVGDDVAEVVPVRVTEKNGGRIAAFVLAAVDLQFHKL